MADAAPDPKVENAHVLTLDVVGYSTLLITAQMRLMAELTSIVKSAPRFRRAETEGRLIRIPTGDGMCWSSLMIRKRRLNAQRRLQRA